MRLVDIEPIVELVKGEHEKVQTSFNEADVREEPNEIALWGAVLQEVGAFIGLMINAPTVDAEPVRHGSWIPVEDDDMFCYCSECGTHEYRETIEVLRYDYCPYCGAKMDAERKEE